VSDQSKVDKAWRSRYVRRPSALFALSIATLFVAGLAYMDWARDQPPSANAATNRYFRFGDPYPVGFPNVSKVEWEDVQKPPWNAERLGEWVVGWHPKNGPFEKVEAEVYTDPGYSRLAVTYDLRPRYLKEFQSCMEEAFAGYKKETDPEFGTKFWRVRGFKCGYYESSYWVAPVFEDPDFPPAVERGLKQTVATVALFCLVYFGRCNVLKRRR